ncbi:enoyl-CoA hydratase-related protein [Streptomyces sp. NPDC055092]
MDRPDDGVAVITLNRPDRRNALSRALLGELCAVLAKLGREAAAGAVRSVVLNGAGPAFCAGLELDEVARLGTPYICDLDTYATSTWSPRSPGSVCRSSPP